MNISIFIRKNLAYFNPNVLLIILVSLVLVNCVLFYFFIVPQFTFSVINQSKSYKLTYNPSEYFTEFINTLPQEQDYKIKKIKIIFSDRHIAASSPGRLTPVKVDFVRENSTKNVIVFNIGIDPVLARDFDQIELNSITTGFILLNLYNITHQNYSITRRQEDINHYSKLFYSLKHYPFSLDER